jgi:hypothetical protein
VRVVTQTCLAVVTTLIFPILLVVAPPVRAASADVAVLPISAPGLLPSASQSLEQDLRDAVASFGVTVQPAAETQAHLSEGAKAGLDCRLTDEACALRVGLIADVEVVLVTSVELIGDRMLLRGAWLGVADDTRRRVAGEIKMPALDGGRLLRATVGRIVTGKGDATPLPVELSVDPVDARVQIDGEPQLLPKGTAAGPAGVIWLVPGEHSVRVEADGHETVERSVTIAPDGSQGALAFALPTAARVEEASSFVYVGAAMATVGAVLAVAGGAGATFVESELQEGKISDERRGDSLLLGQVSLGSVALGVLMAAGGAALALVEQGAEDDTPPAGTATTTTGSAR